MTRPPIVVVLVALVMIALGETSGAALSTLRGPLARYAGDRITANAAVHGLTGSAEYDDEVRRRASFAFEAGLSFFHTHAEGVGLIVLFVSTVTANVVAWRPARALVYALVTGGGLFPLGYLAYAGSVLELGREAGIELAERWILTPLGSSVIAGLVALVAILIASLARHRPA